MAIDCKEIKFENNSILLYITPITTTREAAFKSDATAKLTWTEATAADEELTWTLAPSDIIFYQAPSDFINRPFLITSATIGVDTNRDIITTGMDGRGPLAYALKKDTSHVEFNTGPDPNVMPSDSAPAAPMPILTYVGIAILVIMAIIIVIVAYSASGSKASASAVIVYDHARERMRKIKISEHNQKLDDLKIQS